MPDAITWLSELIDFLQAHAGYFVIAFVLVFAILIIILVWAGMDISRFGMISLFVISLILGVVIVKSLVDYGIIKNAFSIARLYSLYIPSMSLT